MKNETWKMFELTGSIDAYLNYRNYRSNMNGENTRNTGDYMTEESEELFVEDSERKI